MFTVPLLLAAVIPAADPAPAPRPAGPSATEVRSAAGKALAFLEKSSADWRADRKCVTCHQIPFTVWALSEAKARGLSVDAGKLDDLTGWAFGFCTTDENKGEKTGGFHLTTAFLVLSQAATAPRDDAVKAYPFFETLFAKRQKPDGSWREGNQVKLPGADREADEVDTMWTLLAIRELDRLGGRLPAETRKGLTAEREKGLAFLKGALPGRRIDWLALRALVAREYGTPAEADGLLAELRGQQNPDGGWGYVRGGASYPHTTGECLYALGVAGATGDDPVVRRAVAYLLRTQREDGSWECRSRQAFATRPDKVNAVTTHWGTGWTAIGLLRTLPR
ncbi:MAG TPA: prenyltransferase/squalene oxidase repeat-containing protein [Urbifossiella sp.]|jgi:squalene-hopene/tetraprenyl-beta-curcumene cyclase|nr:prenyltransferase/squalene oxidase repeat-containing protein [Urbifossiella sp.]